LRAITLRLLLLAAAITVYFLVPAPASALGGHPCMTCAICFTGGLPMWESCCPVEDPTNPSWFPCTPYDPDPWNPSGCELGMYCPTAQ